ncbi:MAG TPA: type II toxin-antitoxin system RelE/ParE family toxin [Elusimicrobiota bacterium]|nr:type II toxin-antitoxin system RelE/ParE family toxin [Elusimicrobiota bacterium]
MNWAVEFHPLVRDQDLPALDRAGRGRVLKSVREKLATNPEAYGERLRAGLHGYWKLRVGEYRVIYEIRKKLVTVLVLKIGYRRDDEVYKQMSKRLRGL